MSTLSRVRVSVAMCTFNGERYLQEQLESIAAQSRPPHALFISDDRSTDGTVELVEKFAASSPFPVEVSVAPRRLGVIRNYERAVSQCDGDVIVLSDQDDIWLPQRLAYIESVFSSAPDVALAFSDAYLVDADGRPNGDRLWDVLRFTERQRQRMRHHPFGQLMGRSIVTGCTLAIRASGRKLILPFPDKETVTRARVLHDGWMSLALAAAHGVAVIDEPLVQYRLHSGQQIGIPGLPIRSLIPSSVWRLRSAAVPSREYAGRLAANACLLGVIAGRLREVLPADRSGEAEARVRDAIEHVRAREAIYGPRFRRVRPILREATTGRYQRYSLGVASAAADLIRSEQRWRSAER